MIIFFMSLSFDWAVERLGRRPDVTLNWAKQPSGAVYSLPAF
jgi:hypothetical protein